MLCPIRVRRLKEGATYEDSRAAWLPDQGFGMPIEQLPDAPTGSPRSSTRPS